MRKFGEIEKARALEDFDFILKTQWPMLERELASCLLVESDCSFNDFINWLYSKYSEKPADIIAATYRFILDKAGLWSLKKYLYENFLDTSFDIESAQAEEILKSIPVEKRNKQYFFIKKELLK